MANRDGGAQDLALGFETRPWAVEPGAAMSRSQRARIRPDYLAAVTSSIATMSFDIEAAVAAEADDARAEIARFDAELSALFSTSRFGVPASSGAPIEFAPLSAVLLRTESASSSQIENITTGARALALAEIGLAQHGSNAELVAANVDAMNRALDLSDAVTPEAILDVHEALTRGQAHANPGHFRTEQVWIGGHAASPHDAEFIPPHHERVPAAIDDLCAFTDRTDVPLLIHVAIAHAQFETIHPFNDGNGRTGRALVHAMLRRAGATTRTTIPVSAGLLGDTDRYFDALGAYRAGDPNPIVERFSHAAFAAITNGRTLATDLVEVHQRWTEQLAEARVRSDAAVWRVLPHLLSSPAVTSALVQERAGVSQPTADNALRLLTDLAIVSRPSSARRNVVWVADAVIDSLDAFGQRARRR